jgi:hypothetical protein
VTVAVAVRRAAAAFPERLTVLQERPARPRHVPTHEPGTLYETKQQMLPLSALQCPRSRRRDLTTVPPSQSLDIGLADASRLHLEN